MARQKSDIILILACMNAKLIHLCPTLCDSMDCSLPSSSVHGILQERILKWVAIPFLIPPRDQTRVSHIAGRFFTIWATTEVLQFCFGSGRCLILWCSLMCSSYIKPLSSIWVIFFTIHVSQQNVLKIHSAIFPRSGRWEQSTQLLEWGENFIILSLTLFIINDA